MIYVTFNPKKRKLRVKGHASYAAEGHDVICAAASMVFYNLCEMLGKYDGEKAFAKPLEIVDKKGNAKLCVTPHTGYEPWIDHDFCYAISGFSLLSQKFPEYITLRVTEN